MKTYRRAPDADKVTIVTTTFYNPDSEIDRVRSNLAVQMVRSAAGAGYQVIVVDGGSRDDKFLGKLREYGADLHVQKANGFGSGRREAIGHAYNSGKPIIAMTEPEKVPLIPQLRKIILPLLYDEADLVVPKRRSLDSLPPSQRYAELYGNQVWKEITGTDLDMWFGPKTWRKLPTPGQDYFLAYDNREYGDRWDSINIPVMLAMLSGKKVKSVLVPYTHPREQTLAEEGDPELSMKRLQQLNNLIPAFKYHWDKSHNKT